MDSSRFTRDRWWVWSICGLGMLAIGSAELLDLFEIPHYPYQAWLMLGGAIPSAIVLLAIVWRHRVAREASAILGIVAGTGVVLILLELPPVEALGVSWFGPGFDRRIDTVQEAISYGLASLAAMGVALLAIRSSQAQAEQATREARLRDSEDQFRRAVVGAPFPIMLHAEGGRVLQLSRAWEEISGYTHEEIPTIAAWTSRAYGDKHAYAASEIEKHFGQTQGGHKGEFPVRAKAGDLRIWDFSVSAPGRDGRGRNVVVTMAMDTTARRRAEREQAARNQVLEKLTSGAALEDVLSAVVGTAEHYSTNWRCSILVVDEGRGHLRLGAAPSLPADYREAIDGMAIGPEVGCCGAAACVGKRVIVEDLVTHPNWEAFREPARRADLGACWSEPILSPSGEVLGTFAVYHRRPYAPTVADLAFAETQAKLAGIAIERRKAEAALRKSEELFRSSVENARSVIVCLTLEGMVMEWNREAERVYGVSRAEAIGRFYPSLRYPAEIREGVRKRMEWVLQGNEVRGQERVVVHRDGSERTILWNISLLKGDGGKITGMIGSGQDITEYKAFQSQMQHAQKLESLGVLAGGIAHDFNNVLVGILGNADLVKAALGEDSPAAEGVDLIRRSARHAADLTHQMLAYAGKGEATVDRQDLSALVKEMCDLLRISVSKHVAIREDFAMGLPAIKADASQLQQVVMNLITNGSEAIGDEEGEITLTTGVVDAGEGFLSGAYSDSAPAPGEYVYVRVEDTGCGMDGETAAKMFDPFFTTKFAGRGLGLAAALGIIRAHRGAIKVDSEPGKGTTIWILFPPAPGAVDALSAPADFPARVRRGGTILVVDDEETVSSVARRVLEGAGFTVLCAGDGLEGLEVFRRHRAEIDVVLLDMTMPKMGGKETLAAMQIIRPDVRVVLTSGYDEENVAIQFSNGNDRQSFLQKPFGARRLVEAIDGMLGQADGGETDRETPATLRR